MTQSCDTTVYLVTVTADTMCMLNDTIVMTIAVGETITELATVDDACVINQDTIYNDCTDLSGTEVLFDNLDTNPAMVDITGLAVGVDTACIITCDTTSTPGTWICDTTVYIIMVMDCLLYTSPSPRDKRQSRMPSSA